MNTLCLKKNNIHVKYFVDNNLEKVGANFVGYDIKDPSCLLNEKNPNLWVFGKDYLNKPVEGNIVKSILKENKNVI